MPTLYVNGVLVTDTDLRILVGKTIIKVRVQPPDDDLPASDYTITVTRQEPTKGTDASLATLTLASGDIDIALDKSSKPMSRRTPPRSGVRFCR